MFVHTTHPSGFTEIKQVATLRRSSRVTKTLSKAQDFEEVAETGLRKKKSNRKRNRVPDEAKKPRAKRLSTEERDMAEILKHSTMTAEDIIDRLQAVLVCFLVVSWCVCVFSRVKEVSPFFFNSLLKKIGACCTRR